MLQSPPHPRIPPSQAATGSVKRGNSGVLGRDSKMSPPGSQAVPRAGDAGGSYRRVPPRAAESLLPWLRTGMLFPAGAALGARSQSPGSGCPPLPADGRGDARHPERGGEKPVAPPGPAEMADPGRAMLSRPPLRPAPRCVRAVEGREPPKRPALGWSQPGAHHQHPRTPKSLGGLELPRPGSHREGHLSCRLAHAW